MAARKQSAFPSLTSLADGDELPIVDASETTPASKNKRTTLATLKAWLAAIANPMTTAGDLIVGGVNGAPARLAKGANGTVLGMASGVQAWLDLTTEINARIAAWVGAAPTALDTLDELAAALADDANFAATVTAALGNKQPLDATLTALAALTAAADKLVYATGPDAFATVDFPAFARTLAGSANAGAAARALREAATAITYASSISPDCNDGLHRSCTMTGDLVVNAPSNGADGMVWRGRFLASGAARELTFHSAIKLPTGSTYEATVASGATRVIHLEHDGTRWLVVRNLEFAA